MIQSFGRNWLISESGTIQSLDRTCLYLIQEVKGLEKNTTTDLENRVNLICQSSAQAMNEVFKKYAMLNIKQIENFEDSEEEVTRITTLQFNNWNVDNEEQFQGLFEEVKAVYRRALSQLQELQKELQNLMETAEIKDASKNEAISNEPLMEMPQNQENFEHNLEIVVICEVGEGDFLAVRGEDCSGDTQLAINSNNQCMTWDNGLSMTKEENNTWKIRLKTPPNFAFKILYNDVRWESGDNRPIQSDNKPLEIRNISFQN
jgi:hypothetical protein